MPARKRWEEILATITVRLSDELKSNATEVAEYYGFDLRSLTRAFYTQMVRERAIPRRLDSYEPIDESLHAIAETDAAIASGGYDTFDDATSLLAAVGA